MATPGWFDKINVNSSTGCPPDVWRKDRETPMTTVRTDSADRAARVVRVRDVLAPSGRLRAVCFKTVNDKRTAAGTARELSSDLCPKTQWKGPETTAPLTTPLYTIII